MSERKRSVFRTGVHRNCCTAAGWIASYSDCLRPTVFGVAAAMFRRRQIFRRDSRREDITAVVHSGTATDNCCSAAARNDKPVSVL